MLPPWFSQLETSIFCGISQRSWFPEVFWGSPGVLLCWCSSARSRDQVWLPMASFPAVCQAVFGLWWTWNQENSFFWLSWMILDDVGWFGLDQIGWFHIDLGWYRMILEDTVVDFDDIGRYWMMVRNAWQPKARSQDALGCWRTGTWQGMMSSSSFPRLGGKDLGKVTEIRWFRTSCPLLK